MRQSLYIVFILFLFTTACKKEEPNQNNACAINNTSGLINSQDLDNCKYIEGTFWVYIDSVNLQMDSTAIDATDQGLITETICNNSYQHFTFYTTSYPSLSSEIYRVVPGGLFKNATSVNSGTQIYDDYSASTVSIDPSINKFDSLFIYDQYYYDVIQIIEETDASEGNAKSIYYCNSDYGILRHEIYDNSVLISNKILKSKLIIR